MIRPNRPARFRYLGLALIVAGLAVFAGACRNETDDRFFKIPTDFTLTDHTGAPFRMADQKGKVVLLYFGFTNCPDFCPQTLAKIRRAYEIIGARSAKVQTVMVTVDPERDTAEALARFMGYYEINALGLRGAPEEIRAVAAQFGAFYQRAPLPESALGYTVDHSTQLFLIDQEGRVRQLLKSTDSPAAVADAVERLLPWF